MLLQTMEPIAIELVHRVVKQIQICMANMRIAHVHVCMPPWRSSHVLAMCMHAVQTPKIQMAAGTGLPQSLLDKVLGCMNIINACRQQTTTTGIIYIVKLLKQQIQHAETWMHEMQCYKHK